MHLTLVRDYSESDCSQGLLVLASGFRAGPWQTIEPPWIPSPDGPCGLKGRSCFPAGDYRLVRHDTEAHPRTWALVNPDLWVYHWDTDVPVSQRGIARTVCLLHIANFAIELRGCCALGKLRSVTPEGRRMVQQSGRGPWGPGAMAELQEALPWTDDHTLTVSYAQDR